MLEDKICVISGGAQGILLSPEQVAKGIVSVLKTDAACMIKEMEIRSVHDADTMAEIQVKGAV